MAMARALACLFITHDVAVVSEVAHSLIVLERGEVRDSGDTGAILAHPESPYTQRLLSAYCAQEYHALAPNEPVDLEKAI